MKLRNKKVKQIENDLDDLCQRIDYIEDWAYLIFDYLGVKVEAKEELEEDGTVARFSDWKLIKK